MKKDDGFTILEMMIVLSVIALIFLLTLPNIQQKEDIIRNKGCEALTEVVNSQILLYEIENLSPPTTIQQLTRENAKSWKPQKTKHWKCGKISCNSYFCKGLKT